MKRIENDITSFIDKESGDLHIVLPATCGELTEQHFSASDPKQVFRFVRPGIIALQNTANLTEESKVKPSE